MPAIKNALEMRGKIDSAAIGIEVSWSFGDGDAEAVTLPRSLVQDILRKNGLDADLLELPDADTALRTAQQVVKGRSKDLVIAELRRPNKDTPRAVGVYQVQGKEGESGDDMVCGARVRVENGRVCALPPEGSQEIAPCMVVAKDLERISNSLIDNAVNRDISNVLVSIGWSSYWITRRRNSGGVYFIPAGKKAEQFLSVLESLQAATSPLERKNQFIPQVMEVYEKPLTMQMWAGSARDQYDAQVAGLLDDLKKMESSDTMRESTMAKRADECAELMLQAEKHRMFLQEHAESIKGELERIRLGFLKRLKEVQQTSGESLSDAMAAMDAVAPKARAKRAPKATPTPVAQPTAPAGEYSDADLFDV